MSDVLAKVCKICIEIPTKLEVALYLQELWPLSRLCSSKEAAMMMMTTTVVGYYY